VLGVRRQASEDAAARSDPRTRSTSPARWAAFTLALSLFVLGAYLLPVSDPPGEVEPGPWYSLLPPVLAVLLAAFFRQVIVALASGVLLGSLLAFGLDLLTGARRLLWENVADPFNLAIIGFTFALVGMVNVTSRSGGNRGLVEALARRARTARSTRVMTALMGLAIFFDDYANSVVVGTTMRRLTDRMRISRERLAYLVDSTAAPIAGISLVSTWIAYEVGLFGDLADEIGLPMGGYEIFVAVLPFRFYCFSALALVLLGAGSGRDYGPMYRAEKRAAEDGLVHEPDAQPLGGEALDATQPPESAPKRWYNAVIPIAVVVLGVVGGMLWSGRHAVRAAGRTLTPFDLEVWRLAFGGADSANVLLAASLAGSAVAIGLALAQRILPPKEAAVAWLRTFPAMWQAVTILILAWAMKSVCLELGTDRFLLAVLGDRVPLEALPLAVFGLGAAIAFATGTSFGTMGILLPVALPLAYTLGGRSVELFLVGAAVLDGAIYGDHCSPISDTTVLSSASSGCDHIDHVRTQIPYATTSMAIAAVAYLSVALGAPRWVPYPLIPLATLGVLFSVGRRLPRTRPKGASG
jgi:Na+/H+ antiporter NhaC